jgi:hypothetical protein
VVGGEALEQTQAGGERKDGNGGAGGGVVEVVEELAVEVVAAFEGGVEVVEEDDVEGAGFGVGGEVAVGEGRCSSKEVMRCSWPSSKMWNRWRSRPWMALPWLVTTTSTTVRRVVSWRKVGLGSGGGLEVWALQRGDGPATKIRRRQPMASRRCMLAMVDELLRIFVGCGLRSVECAGWHSHGRESDAIIDERALQETVMRQIERERRCRR